MSEIITPENSHEFDKLPDRAFFQLYVPMICPDCSDIHSVLVEATAVPKEGGLVRLVQMIQARRIKQGFRIPSQEDFETAQERMKAQEKEQTMAKESMEEAEEAAKVKNGGLFFINRKPRQGGDA